MRNCTNCNCIRTLILIFSMKNLEILSSNCSKTRYRQKGARNPIFEYLELGWGVPPRKWSLSKSQILFKIYLVPITWTSQIFFSHFDWRSEFALRGFSSSFFAKFLAYIFDDFSKFFSTLGALQLIFPWHCSVRVYPKPGFWVSIPPLLNS